MENVTHEISFMDKELTYATKEGSRDACFHPNRSYHADVFIHIIAITFFGIIGVCGNVAVLFIYAKAETKYTGTFYIKSLAYMDILGLLIFLFQFPIFTSIPCMVRIWIFNLPLNSYVGIYLLILDAIAFDRLFAVFKPHALEYNKKRVRYIAMLNAFIWTICSAISSLDSVYYNEYASSFALFYLWLVFIFGFFTLLFVYPLIALKLYNLSRKVKPSTAHRRTRIHRAEIATTLSDL